MGDDYQEQWDDIDEKVLLVQILTELQQIRVALTDAQSRSEQEQDADTYQCKRCNATVQADARERHAREQHKAPPDMEDVLFTPE
jgi:hypothetical protein